MAPTVTPTLITTTLNPLQQLQHETTHHRITTRNHMRTIKIDRSTSGNRGIHSSCNTRIKGIRSGRVGLFHVGSVRISGTRRILITSIRWGSCWVMGNLVIRSLPPISLMGIVLLSRGSRKIRYLLNGVFFFFFGV